MRFPLAVVLVALTLVGCSSRQMTCITSRPPAQNLVPQDSAPIGHRTSKSIRRGPDQCAPIGPITNT